MLTVAIQRHRLVKGCGGGSGSGNGGGGSPPDGSRSGGGGGGNNDDSLNDRGAAGDRDSSPRLGKREHDS